jgi:type IV pilus assembly protein PilW
MTSDKRQRVRSRRSRQGGLSLIELMVGLLVGLIITLAITASVATISKQLRTTGGGINAGEEAQLSVTLIDRDLRMAGAAIFANSVATMCPTVNEYKNGATLYDGTSLGSAFAPVRITDGGTTGSDTIDVENSPPSTTGTFTAAIVKEMPATAGVLKVTDPRNTLYNGDLIFVAHPLPNPDGDPCTLIQVTGITGSCTSSTTGCNVVFDSGQSLYNPSNPNHAFTSPQTYGPGSVLVKMPTFAYTRYEVKCNALLRHDKTVTPSCSGSPSFHNSAIADQIVMLKAQYGIAEAGSDAIASWKSAATITEDEMNRVKAVRVAVVARSREPDSMAVTTSAPTVFGGALTLNLSGTSVPAGKTWQNFRYRIFETMTPLRNVAWNR